MDWDQYFMSQAYLAGMKSKDRSTHVGAIIVGPDNEIRSTGYNSFPRGMDDNVESRHQRPDKYIFTEHAERNAIYNAARMGTSLNGCRIYCNFHPCADCMRGIANVGIREVIIHREFPGNTSHAIWDSNIEASKTIASECGIAIRYWSGSIVVIEGLVNGKRFVP